VFVLDRLSATDRRWCRALFADSGTSKTSDQSPHTSVNHVLGLIFPLEVWDIERLDRLQRQVQRLVRSAAIASPQILPHLPQRTQHPRPIESLTLTVIAVAHRLSTRLADQFTESILAVASIGAPARFHLPLRSHD
jgi:hypothetical protein